MAAGRLKVWDATASAWTYPGIAPSQVGQMQVVVAGGGGQISGGATVDIGPMKWGGTWTDWALEGDRTGSIQFDIWKTVFPTVPTNANSITGSAPPKMTNALTNASSTLTGWTTTFAAGDRLRLHIDSSSKVRQVTLTVNYVRS